MDGLILPSADNSLEGIPSYMPQNMPRPATDGNQHADTSSQVIASKHLTTLAHVPFQHACLMETIFSIAEHFRLEPFKKLGWWQVSITPRRLLQGLSRLAERHYKTCSSLATVLRAIEGIKLLIHQSQHKLAEEKSSRWLVHVRHVLQYDQHANK